MYQDNFNFWCPVKPIEKAINQETGQEIMRLGGIASTSDEDSDGEFLDPKGFDIKPLIERGIVNWHHQAKNNPATIIGEPSKAEIRKEGLYIETDLYPSSQVAREVWELAQTLDNDSKTRRLGYSIEGKVVKRKSNNPTDPGYKVIEKAIITGVAITHQPKNPKTFANIIKGEIDDMNSEETETTETTTEVEETEEEKKKGLTTYNGRPLIKEDVDKKVKVQTFGKAEVMERLFKDIPGIELEKAEKIYSLINSITIMAKRKRVTEDDILKAYDALGLDPVDIQKGEDAEEAPENSEENETEEENEDIKKSKKLKKSEPSEDNADDSESDDEDADDEGAGDGDEDVDDSESEDEGEKPSEVRKGNLFTHFDRIEKAIATSHLNQVSYVKALAVMLKDSSQKLEKATDALTLANQRIDDLMDITKAQEDTISALSSKIEEYGSGVPGPKSLRHAAPVERPFGKARENEFEKGGDDAPQNQVSLSNRNAVAEILDQATFAKGYDDEFSKACMSFEANGQLTPNIIARIKNEMGIEIVK